MFFVAVLMLGMAALFFVLSALVTQASLGFVITGAVLAPVGVLMLVLGFVMLAKRANMQRVMAGGVPGQAHIIGVRQTGIYVNRQPQVELQLQISTAMRPPYNVTRNEVVPLIHVGRLTSGQPLPVMVDQTRPDNVVILWDAAPMGFGAPMAAVPNR